MKLILLELKLLNVVLFSLKWALASPSKSSFQFGDWSSILLFLCILDLCIGVVYFEGDEDVAEVLVVLPLNHTQFFPILDHGGAVEEVIVAGFMSFEVLLLVDGLILARGFGDDLSDPQEADIGSIEVFKQGEDLSVVAVAQHACGDSKFDFMVRIDL